MKVVLVGDYPKNNQIETGVQSVLTGLTTALLKQKEVELVLVSLNSSVFLNRYSTQCPTYTLNLRSSYFRAKEVFKDICRKQDADVIHLQGVVPGILLYDTSLADKFIVTQHAIYGKERQQQVSLLRKAKFYLKEMIERHYLKRVENVIFISDYNKEIFRREIRELNSLNYKTIPNPVNDIFNNKEKATTTTWSGNDMYFLGELKKRKGIHILIQAMAILKSQGISCKLHVIGGFKEASYRRDVYKLLSESGLENEIIFCGWKETSEILTYTKDIPIFVLPSFQETLPLSIAEAMTMGKLVVATNAGGTPEMIRNGMSGLLFEPGDPIALAKILSDVLTNPAKYEAIAQCAKDESQKYHEGVVTKQTIEFYKTIVEKNKYS